MRCNGVVVMTLPSSLAGILWLVLGLLTIRTEQFTREGESVVNVQLQRVEKAVVRLLERVGVTPPAHPLLPDAHAALK